MTPNGEAIRKIREKAGVHRVQLAEAAGITPKSINNIESGYAGASNVTLYRIANFLGVDISEITVSDRVESAA